MNLDLAKNSDLKPMFWTRVLMLICFGVAATILAVSLMFPTPARAIHPGAGTTVQKLLSPAPKTMKVAQHALLP
jgi:hypothetical protein